MDIAIETLQDLIIREEPGAPVALYLTGSYCDGGLRPDSDLDVVLITQASLDDAERRMLTAHLLGYSGRRATKHPGRPIELISLVLTDIKPWRYPATRDYLYGEWLRTDYEADRLPPRQFDPPTSPSSSRRRASTHTP